MSAGFYTINAKVVDLPLSTSTISTQVCTNLDVLMKHKLDNIVLIIKIKRTTTPTNHKNLAYTLPIAGAAVAGASRAGLVVPPPPPPRVCCCRTRAMGG